mmetsp:Transcript_29988/g.80231  ORF Transcript_29988/g.80231 Transcript_29988/m.80231 type:complete len:301 (-) Transcript_29988:94-996(-)
MKHTCDPNPSESSLASALTRAVDLLSWSWPSPPTMQTQTCCPRSAASCSMDAAAWSENGASASSRSTPVSSCSISRDGRPGRDCSDSTRATRPERGAGASEGFGVKLSSQGSERTWRIGDLTDLPSPLAVEGFSNCRRLIRPNSLETTLPAERSALSGMPSIVGWGSRGQEVASSSSSSPQCRLRLLLRRVRKPLELVFRMPSSRTVLALREPVSTELRGGCASKLGIVRALFKKDWAKERCRLGVADGAVWHVRHRSMPAIVVKDSLNDGREEAPCQVLRSAGKTSAASESEVSPLALP